ncbi:hypothetical protein ACFQ9Y_25375 [Peribacillus simplex]|uniref:hypothetical protein n=1 Tax=Peribacillus simplex TaxID=1478 RepID=UPI00366FF602
MEEHLDSSYGIWLKLEGKRSKLNQWQLSLLQSWDCCRNSNEIMKKMVSILPEFLRQNQYLSKKVEIEANEDLIKMLLKWLTN